MMFLAFLAKLLFILQTYECVVLEPESPEYVDVVFKFHESMKFPVADIVKISRIQNPIFCQK
jgi:hypothetical protein